jgi:hypothetical protein
MADSARKASKERNGRRLKKLQRTANAQTPAFFSPACYLGEFKHW